MTSSGGRSSRRASASSACAANAPAAIPARGRSRSPPGVTASSSTISSTSCQPCSGKPTKSTSVGVVAVAERAEEPQAADADERRADARVGPRRPGGEAGGDRRHARRSRRPRPATGPTRRRRARPARRARRPRARPPRRRARGPRPGGCGSPSWRPWRRSSQSAARPASRIRATRSRFRARHDDRRARPLVRCARMSRSLLIAAFLLLFLVPAAQGRSRSSPATTRPDTLCGSIDVPLDRADPGRGRRSRSSSRS